MSRWICKVAYDGTDFDGWQSQPSGNAIQDHLERRLSELLKHPVGIQGSGRTDAGVHARAQVFHTDIDWDHGADALKRAVNTGLPLSIRLLDCQKTAKDTDFHARFSATGKRYTYHICFGEASPFEIRYITPLHTPRFSMGAMLEATTIFKGTHDFASFAARREAGVPVTDAVRTISKIEWHEDSKNRWTLRVDGDGFLYKMVRSIAGTLLQVGQNRLQPSDIQRILSGGERTHEVNTAPAKGLFLDQVFYPEDHR
ncbi:MAG: tRNA pseudouridine(38-40) synthase TruA [Opitutales bacterium]